MAHTSPEYSKAESAARHVRAANRLLLHPDKAGLDEFRVHLEQAIAGMRELQAGNATLPNDVLGPVVSLRGELNRAAVLLRGAVGVTAGLAELTRAMPGSAYGPEGAAPTMRSDPGWSVEG